MARRSDRRPAQAGPHTWSRAGNCLVGPPVPISQLLGVLYCHEGAAAGLRETTPCLRMAPSRRRGKTAGGLVVARGGTGGPQSRLLPAACGRRGLRGVGVRRAFWTFLNLSAHARLSCAAELINNGVRTAWLVYALSIDDAIMCLSFVQLLL